MSNKPIHMFLQFNSIVDVDGGICANISGYDGKEGLHATTSQVVSEFTTDQSGQIVRFETLNSIYVKPVTPGYKPCRAERNTEM